MTSKHGKMMGYHHFRRNFTPAFKSIVSSVADIIGDWTFYLRTVNGIDALNKFELPLFAFCVISTVFGVLAVVALFMKGCSCSKEGGRMACCAEYVKFFLGLEIIFEDIPQFILTWMIQMANGGVWTPTAVFNVTTSAFNFLFNILDMFIPEEPGPEEMDTYYQSA